MPSLYSIGRVAGAGLLCAALAAAAAAQEQQSTEFPSWRVPGWSFTPGVSMGTVFDSNVTITGPDQFGKTPTDTYLLIEPSGQLEFFSARTSFSSGYRGAMQRYFEFSPLDTMDHRAYFSLRHRVTRRVTLFATDSFSQLPTTDLLELNGLPFARVGSRYNAAGAGFEARLTKLVDFNAQYEMTWVDFLRDDTPLTGGIVHGIHGALKRHFSDRFVAGGEYGLRWADLNGGVRQFTYQDVGGLLEFHAGERTLLEVAAGLTHLSGGLGSLPDQSFGLSKSSPYARASITHHLERATVGGEYLHSYAPSFYLGGSHQSTEARGYIDMPFNRNRLYVQESAAWRRTNPVVETDRPLDSLWLRSTLGYAVQRWLRIEGFHIYTAQTNRLAGGRIMRHQLGAQLVVAEPMRIR